MPILGTFNGASILVFPAKPDLRQVTLKTNDTNAVQRSPYTGSTQIQAWPGADWWSAEIALPQMTPVNAALWSGFLAECRGMLNVFLFGHPLFRKPQGKPKGAPVVSGVNAAMATTLSTRGWKPNTNGHLLPGDYLQIGTTPTLATAGQPGLCRYHRVCEQVNSDGNGNATITVWPSLREATTDGEVIILNNPRGLFRLASNDSSMLSTETRLSSVSLQIVEAR